MSELYTEKNSSALGYFKRWLQKLGKTATDETILGKHIVFIAGFARGGTTWLRRALSLHPDIAEYPKEIVFSKEKELTRDKIIDILKQALDGRHISESYLALKAPANAVVLQQLASLLPEAKFLFIIRDPRDVLTSHIKGAKSWMKGANSEVEGCMRKTRRYYEGYVKASNLENVYLVRYEDIHQQFKPTYKALCHFIGVSVRGAVLRNSHAFASFQKQTGRSHSHDNPHAAARRGVVGEWNHTLTVEDEAWYQASSFWQEFFKRYGYHWQRLTTERLLDRACKGSEKEQTFKRMMIILDENHIENTNVYLDIEKKYQPYFTDIIFVATVGLLQRYQSFDALIENVCGQLRAVYIYSLEDWHQLKRDGIHLEPEQVYFDFSIDSISEPFSHSSLYHQVHQEDLSIIKVDHGILNLINVDEEVNVFKHETFAHLEPNSLFILGADDVTNENGLLFAYRQYLELDFDKWLCPYIEPKHEEEYARNIVYLRQLLDNLKPKKNSRLLVLSTGGFIEQGITLLLSYFNQKLTVVDGCEKRCQEICDVFPNQVEVIHTEPQYYSDRQYDVVVVISSASHTSLVMTEILDTASRSLKVGGLFLFHAVYNTRLNRKPLPLNSKVALKKIDDFLEQNMQTWTPHLRQFLKPLDEMSFELERFIPNQVAKNAKPYLAWFALTKLKEFDNAFFVSKYCANRNNTFHMQAYCDWLESVKSHGWQFVFPDDYVKVVRQDEGPEYEQPTRNQLFILKHDIHHDLRRTVLMAEAEAKLGIKSVYLMMGPHLITEKFYHQPLTFKLLRYIQSLGHQIGLHLDVTDMIRQEFDLYHSIERIVHQFKSEGLTVRYANGHGNTEEKKQTKLKQGNFIKEITSVRENYIVPDILKDEINRYSLKELSTRFGIDFWLDSQIYYKGTEWGKLGNVTDNSGRLACKFYDVVSDKYDISQRFIDKFCQELNGMDILCLVHPQLYER